MCKRFVDAVGGPGIEYRAAGLEAPDERDGYVPNVVYSCGSIVHNGNLIIPYGIGDCAIGVATVPLPVLLDALGGG